MFHFMVSPENPQWHIRNGLVCIVYEYINAYAEGVAGIRERS